MVRDEGELAYWRRHVEDPILQEYLSGPEVTSDVVCDFEGQVLGITSRQRIAIRGGEASKSVTVRND
ncbi:MAG TPA: hypothetical protein VIY86_04225, partial [Pirellulaceae bacterium]